VREARGGHLVVESGAGAVIYFGYYAEIESLRKYVNSKKATLRWNSFCGSRGNSKFIRNGIMECRTRSKQALSS
jgi:hypothetical protein